MERLLALACEDGAFADDLVSRRSAAATDRGIALGDSDRAMLDAASDAQLRGLIDGLARGRRRATSAGSDPDGVEPPMEPFFFGGIRSDLPEEPSEPTPVVRGHSSALPIVAAAGAAVLVGGAIAASCCTAGMRTDVPPAPPPPPGAASHPEGERTPTQPSVPGGAGSAEPRR
jgi:hypothetical protein